ncbi:hypothetical protein M8C21_029236, partial [Ambrosia artemisiifolia]
YILSSVFLSAKFTFDGADGDNIGVANEVCFTLNGGDGDDIGVGNENEVRFSTPESTYRRLSSHGGRLFGFLYTLDRRFAISTWLLMRLPCVPSHGTMANPTCKAFLGSSLSTNKSWNINYVAILDSSPRNLQSGIEISWPKVIYCMLNSRNKHVRNEELHSLFGKKSIPRIKIQDNSGFFSKFIIIIAASSSKVASEDVRMKEDAIATLTHNAEWSENTLSSVNHNAESS